MRISRNSIWVWFLLAVSVLPATAFSQQFVYRVDSSASVIHQTGGGWGLARDLTASGTFEVTIDGNQIVFRNIDVVFSPSNWAPEVFPEYPGEITGAIFSGNEHPCPTYSPSWFSGSLSGDHITFEGYYEMCAADGFDFSYSIEAFLQQQTAVPILDSWGIAVLSIAVISIGMWIIRRNQ